MKIGRFWCIISRKGSRNEKSLHLSKFREPRAYSLVSTQTNTSSLVLNGNNQRKKPCKIYRQTTISVHTYRERTFTLQLVKKSLAKRD